MKYQYRWGGQTTVYVNRFYEKNLTTAEVTLYYYLGDRLVALKKGTDLKYVHQDHLTGTAVMSNTAGNSEGSIKYYPFGATRAGTVPTDRKFTGQILDSIGLYYYGARYYDAEIGRFISADSVVPNFANPQALNRYSYVYNNPLRYIDPSGTVAALPPQLPPAPPPPPPPLPPPGPVIIELPPEPPPPPPVGPVAGAPRQPGGGGALPKEPQRQPLDPTPPPPPTQVGPPPTILTNVGDISLEDVRLLLDVTAAASATLGFFAFTTGIGAPAATVLLAISLGAAALSTAATFESYRRGEASSIEVATSVGSTFVGFRAASAAKYLRGQPMEAAAHYIGAATAYYQAKLSLWFTKGR